MYWSTLANRLARRGTAILPPCLTLACVTFEDAMRSRAALKCEYDWHGYARVHCVSDYNAELLALLPRLWLPQLLPPRTLPQVAEHPFGPSRAPQCSSVVSSLVEDAHRSAEEVIVWQQRGLRFREPGVHLPRERRARPLILQDEKSALLR